MMGHPARQAHIEAHFVAHFTDSGVLVQAVEAADWWQFLDSFPQARYGWTFPCLADVSHGSILGRDIVVAICPQLIAKQTEGLVSAEYHQYLDAIVWMCDRYLELRGDDLMAPLDYETFTALQTQVENELYDLSPPALSTFSRVQLAVLEP